MSIYLETYEEDFEEKGLKADEVKAAFEKVSAMLKEGEDKIKEALAVAVAAGIQIHWRPDFYSEAFGEEDVWNSSWC